MDELAVSVVTLAELRAGVLAAAGDAERGRRLRTLEQMLELDVLPIDRRVAERFAEIAVALRRQGRRIPIQDGWIAATALAWDAGVATQDADFDVVPGLEVVRV